jgi:two-component system OmpR family response regulator
MEPIVTPSKGKVLIIDDDETTLSYARRVLEKAGYSVLTSDSALRMPMIVQKENPDLILLDVEMPALRGDQVLEMSKLFDFLRKSPIVLHSAKSEEELKALVASAGATGYIRKTNNPIQFVRQVEEWVRKPTE